MGHLPSWEPKVATAIVAAIRDACPGIIVNQTTGVIGDDITGPLKCLAAVRPEIAALNAGSLNYLKTRADGTWAWPPHAVRQSGRQDPQVSAGDACARDRARVRVLRPRHGSHGRRGRPQLSAIDRPPKYNLRNGRRIRHARRPGTAAVSHALRRRRRALERHRDRTQGDLAAAPARRRTRRRSAHRPRGLDLPARRLARRLERRSRQGARRRRPRSGTRRSPRPKRRASRSVCRRSRRRPRHDRPYVRRRSPEPVLQARARGVPAKPAPLRQARDRALLQRVGRGRRVPARALSEGGRGRLHGARLSRSATAGPKATASCASSRCRRSRAPAAAGSRRASSATPSARRRSCIAARKR